MPDNIANVDRLRFTNEDSFGLFMEALRFLQHYEDETAKSRPCKADLERTMQAALTCLRECTSRYLFDLLPTFYLGIALGMKNQEVYVQRLFDLTPELLAWGRVLACDDYTDSHKLPGNDSPKPPGNPTKTDFVAQIRDRADAVARPYKDLDERRWPLLEEASRLFETVADKSCPENVKTVARYNLAQVYARRGSRRNLPYLQEALDVLGKSKLDVDVEQLLAEIEERETEQRSKFPESPNASLSPAAKRERDQRIEQLAQEIRSRYEQIALSFQFDSLEQSLAVRVAAATTPFVLKDFTAAYQSFEGVLSKIIDNREMRDPSFKADLLADYLTKAGYIDYELANNRALIRDPNVATLLTSSETRPPQPAQPIRLSAEFFLRRSARYLTAALELKEQWNPAQIYLAVVRRVQAGMVEGKIELIKSEKEQKLAETTNTAREIELQIAEVDARERQLDRVPAGMTELRQRADDAATTSSLKRLLDQAREQMAKDSTPFDQQIADHELEKKRFDAESDELFAVLQGLPWPPAPKSPEFGDG